jgi:hypothetical protein
MKVDEFNKYWEDNYLNWKPISYELRHSEVDRWFRIHSLPESKRYAESEEEYLELLRRQNALFLKLIGNNTEVVLCQFRYRYDDTVMSYNKIPDLVGFSLVDSFVSNEDTMTDIFICITQWIEGKYDKLLREIADGESSVMFICPFNNCILAPYDGGMDIIADSTDERNKLKAKYSQWLSAREDGM